MLRGEPRTLPELIANNGLNAGAVLPTNETLSENPEATIDIEINDRAVDRVALWGFPGGCGEMLDWLRMHLGELGLRLERGHIVLVGTLSDMYPVAPGDRVTVKVHPHPEVVLELRS